jgi:hypothetical protein
MPAPIVRTLDLRADLSPGNGESITVYELADPIGFSPDPSPNYTAKPCGERRRNKVPAGKYLFYQADGAPEYRSSPRRLWRSRGKVSGVACGYLRDSTSGALRRTRHRPAAASGHCRGTMKSADRIVRSSSFDPFRNFAVEDCLFRTADSQTRTLFLWVNDPVVVIGRYQNPWLECRLDALGSDGVPFARRQSGGGACTTTGATSAQPSWGRSAASTGEEYRTGHGRPGGPRRGRRLQRAERHPRGETKDLRQRLPGIGERTFHHLTLLVAADLGRLSRYLQPTLRAAARRESPR